MKETILDSYTKEEFLAIAKEANSITDLCFRLGYKSSSPKTSSLIKKRLNEFKFDLNSFIAKEVSVLNNLTLLEKAVRESYTYSDVLRNFNLAITGGNQKSLKKYIAKFCLSVEHFDDKRHLTIKKSFIHKWNNADIFIINSPVGTELVKNRIIKEKIFPYICRKCHNRGEWCGEAITLQLEHKNGDNKDHRLNNLEFLCPNCHSQTTTYGRKNIKHSPIKNTNHKPLIIAIQNNIDMIVNNIHTYKCLDDILIEYYVRRDKTQREKLISMLKNIKNIKVKKFLENLVINNKKIINFPSAQELLEQVKKSNYSAVARTLNCSDNAIRKHLKKHNLI